jgi:hypothetical protein
MTFELAGAVKIIVGVGAAFAVFWGSITTLDARYETKVAHEPQHEVIQMTFDNMSVSSIKKEIRDIRAKLRTVTDPEYLAELEADLQDAISRLCAINPEDRECVQ